MGSLNNIGLALGSGAARGLAHIGVLKALKEHNIDVDIISGSSAGALIGGLYCCGISPDMIRKLAIQIDKKMWMDLTVPRKGVLKGDRIEEILKLVTGGRRIEELDKKLIIVATDLNKSEKVIIRKGPVYKAIRASISIPGFFEPVRIEDKILVDGGVVDRVPVTVLKEEGADFVIAADVGFSDYQSRLFHVFDIIQKSIDIMAERILEVDLAYADILLKPPLSHIESSKFEMVDECFQIGYDTTIKEIDNIISAIEEHKLNGKKG